MMKRISSFIALGDGRNTLLTSGIPCIFQKIGSIRSFCGKLVATFVFLVAIMTFHPQEFDMVLFNQRK